MAEALHEHRSGACDRNGPSVGQLQSGHSFGDRWWPLPGWKVALNSESVGREGRAVGGVEGGGGGAADDVRVAGAGEGGWVRSCKQR